MLYISESQPGFGSRRAGSGSRGIRLAGSRPRGPELPELRPDRLAQNRKIAMAAGIDLPTKAIHPRPRAIARPQPAARTLTLRPINTNVSFRVQAYSALKQAIMD